MATVLDLHGAGTQTQRMVVAAIQEFGGDDIKRRLSVGCGVASAPEHTGRWDAIIDDSVSFFKPGVLGCHALFDGLRAKNFIETYGFPEDLAPDAHNLPQSMAEQAVEQAAEAYEGAQLFNLTDEMRDTAKRAALAAYILVREEITKMLCRVTDRSERDAVKSYADHYMISHRALEIMFDAAAVSLDPSMHMGEDKDLEPAEDGNRVGRKGARKPPAPERVPSAFRRRRSKEL